MKSEKTETGCRSGSKPPGSKRPGIRHFGHILRRRTCTMLRRTYKLAACTVAACLLCTMAAAAPFPAFAMSTTESRDLATVTSGDTTIEVPVTRQTTQSGDKVTTTVQVLVPDMAGDSPEQNAEQAAQLRENRHFAAPPGNGGESTFGEPGCILYTTTLVYNVQTGQDGVRRYDLISFRLDREIFTMAPYNSVHNATARVDQAGFSDASGDSGLLEEQSKDLGEIEFGKTYGEGTDWPETWFAVATTSDSPQVGITYDVVLDYADGTSRTLSFTHAAT